MRKLIIPVVAISLLATSCVSKKKYVELENQLIDTKGNLQKTTIEKEALENKFATIEKRVAKYNEKINSLTSDNASLQNENDVKLDMVGNTAVISNNTKELMMKTLAKVDPSELAKAKTLKDSLNLAISYNLKNKINTADLYGSNDVNIDIDQTVVMISVSDKLLFNTASYRVKNQAYDLIEKLATIIKSEPSMDVMIEGHTDSRTISNATVQDNWDLSVKRATSIVRLLENKYNIDGSRLIAAGRGSTMPLVENNSNENRAKNRRTRIVILPNLDKFFALLAEEEVLD
ncbi:cell envelope biogenesis protein OmpA [Polaribacter reichenbachii]|uniref:Cell envelope biogenesis protein OmpA n=1 Tax=Polaribacter reichenbachii TaxID=996801 RepID=A0A1B8TPR4_9FLAO|nr:flagellar motor protein MotB [Polaribacter reichenbachii]APZ46840.1 cell envelope biogenesis protein OmpA [Polaribacter reichenbachii]AUC17483.1 cell envelope biogenesis protein OmpA [Polaribacter reichenbachii]OBY61641.1 cell envelope biogenesis protein OmpA [Polaribacter reichenbachii]